MPPSTSENVLPFRTSLKFKFPKFGDNVWINGDTWLDNKRKVDGAEGLWRVHDNLYDLTDFIDVHPGGKMWLQLTKGTDITEAFEIHHLSAKPNKILEKHFVKVTSTPRNSPFTFENDGFYRTLKRRVMPLLKDVPKESVRMSDIMTDVLFFGTFALAILAVSNWSYVFSCFSSIFLALSTVASHNYLHRKDNFRMYYMDLSFLNYREWRIGHALSHHLYPNTMIDFEVISLEPFISYFPRKKTWMLKYGSWMSIIVLWINEFALSMLLRIASAVYLKETKQLHWSNLMPFTLPAVMYLGGGQPLIATLGMWLFILTCGSLLFGFIGFNAGHHHPDIFHDGDLPRSTEKYDWGLHQVDVTADRSEIKSLPFLVLTMFGDHTLHHLFPTLDHGSLKHLYNVFQEVADEFNVNLQTKSQLEMVKGNFMQLAREIPNSKKRS